jgi:hypothetical protein
MTEFDPGRSGPLFNNKFFASTVLGIAPKPPDEIFTLDSLGKEIGFEKPNVIGPAVRRLMEAGLVQLGPAESQFKPNLLRVESEIWLPLSEVARLALAARVEQSDTPNS